MQFFMTANIFISRYLGKSCLLLLSRAIITVGDDDKSCLESWAVSHPSNPGNNRRAPPSMEGKKGNPPHHREKKYQNFFFHSFEKWIFCLTCCCRVPYTSFHIIFNYFWLMIRSFRLSVPIFFVLCYAFIFFLFHGNPCTSTHIYTKTGAGGRNMEKLCIRLGRPVLRPSSASNKLTSHSKERHTTQTGSDE